MDNMDKKLCYIVHFNPIEKYPPVLNLLSEIDKCDLQCRFIVYTTYPNSGNINFYKYIPIIRIKNFFHFKRAIRFIGYAFFHVKLLFLLLKHRPYKILYYESLSSFAPIFYGWLMNWKIKLYVHYHEYTSNKDYMEGMLINRLFHAMEERCYNKMIWISHTNPDRVEKFLLDHPYILKDKLHVLRNFPPLSWGCALHKPSVHPMKVRVIYVGAFSNKTMYIKEFAEWVSMHSGRIVWDIYSHEFDSDTVSLIQKIDPRNISFKGYIPYRNMPYIVSNYDVGVILYRGHIDNYRYNAPNKLFEYYACGLDVWFPEELTSSYKYITNNSYPKILCLDFNRLVDYNLEELISRKGLIYKPSKYFFENEYHDFIQDLIA